MIFLSTMFYAQSAQAKVSNINDDESVQFFRTAAWFDSEIQQWQIPIHAWVYELPDSKFRKKSIAAALKSKYKLEVTASTQNNFDRRVNLLLADNERRKQLVVQIGSQTVVLPRTDARGHVLTTIALSPAQLEPLPEYAKGVVNYSVVLDQDDDRRFEGQSLLVAEQGVSLISDIDDTVKISHVTDRKKLLEQTFYQDFEVVPGMAELYRQFNQEHGPIHFVSSSPWHLYNPLNEFLLNHQFPLFTASLKTIRFKDSSLFNLFKSGDKTKPAQIAPLLERYPQRQFILIGDSGEQDPEVYAQVYQKNPQQIRAIYIRNVTGEILTSERFQKIINSVGERRFILFNDPEQIVKHLEEIEIF